MLAGLGESQGFFFSMVPESKGYLKQKLTKSLSGHGCQVETVVSLRVILKHGQMVSKRCGWDK